MTRCSACGALLVVLTGRRTPLPSAGSAQLAPRLCIARTHAHGDCFPGADTTGLRLGECVRFVYSAPYDGSPVLRTVTRVDARDHPDDCPP